MEVTEYKLLHSITNISFESKEYYEELAQNIFEKIIRFSDEIVRNKSVLNK